MSPSPVLLAFFVLHFSPFLLRSLCAPLHPWRRFFLTVSRAFTIPEMDLSGKNVIPRTGLTAAYAASETPPPRNATSAVFFVRFRFGIRRTIFSFFTPLPRAYHLTRRNPNPTGRGGARVNRVRVTRRNSCDTRRNCEILHRVRCTREVFVPRVRLAMFTFHVDSIPGVRLAMFALGLRLILRDRRRDVRVRFKIVIASQTCQSTARSHDYSPS